MIIDHILTEHSIYHAFNIMTMCAARTCQPLNRQSTYIKSVPTRAAELVDLATNMYMPGNWLVGASATGGVGGVGGTGNAVLRRLQPDKLLQSTQ